MMVLPRRFLGYYNVFSSAPVAGMVISISKTGDISSLLINMLMRPQEYLNAKYNWFNPQGRRYRLDVHCNRSTISIGPLWQIGYGWVRATTILPCNLLAYPRDFYSISTANVTGSIFSKDGTTSSLIEVLPRLTWYLKGFRAN
jgi:hypothetical protein